MSAVNTAAGNRPPGIVRLRADSGSIPGHRLDERAVEMVEILPLKRLDILGCSFPGSMVSSRGLMSLANGWIAETGGRMMVKQSTMAP